MAQRLWHVAHSDVHLIRNPLSDMFHTLSCSASEEAPWPICAAFEKTQSEMKAPSTVFRLMRSTDGTCAPVSPHRNPNCVHASLHFHRALSLRHTARQKFPHATYCIRFWGTFRGTPFQTQPRINSCRPPLLAGKLEINQFISACNRKTCISRQIKTGTL